MKFSCCTVYWKFVFLVKDDERLKNGWEANVIIQCITDLSIVVSVQSLIKEEITHKCYKEEINKDKMNIK